MYVRFKKILCLLRVMEASDSFHGYAAHEYKHAVMRDSSGRFIKSVAHDPIDGSMIVDGADGDTTSVWKWVHDPTPVYQHYDLCPKQQTKILENLKTIGQGWSSNSTLKRHLLTFDNLRSIFIKNRRIETLRSDGQFDTLDRTSEYIHDNDEVAGDEYHSFVNVDNVAQGKDGKTWYVISPKFIIELQSIASDVVNTSQPLFSIDDTDDEFPVGDTPQPLDGDRDNMRVLYDELLIPTTPLAPPAPPALPALPAPPAPPPSTHSDHRALLASLGVYEQRTHDLLVDVEYQAPDHLTALVRAKRTNMSENTFDGIVNIGVSRACYCANLFGVNGSHQQNLRIPLPMMDEKEGVGDGRGRQQGEMYECAPFDEIVVSMRLNCVTSNFVPNAVSNGGYGLVPLDELLEKRRAMVTIKYDQYDQILGVVLLVNPRVVKATSEEQVEVLKAPAELVEMEQAKRKAFNDYFFQMVSRVAHLRIKKFPFESLPNLTKFWVKLPRGMTMLSQISYTHTSMSADQLESLIKAMFMHVCGGDTQFLEKMRGEKKRPSRYFSLTYADVCVKALHLIIRRVNYFADRVIYQDAAGRMITQAVDNFDHSPCADPLNSTEDCDGSSNEAIRLMRQIGVAPFGTYDESGSFVSDDPGYQESKHPMTSTLRDGLFHHFACTSIVSAYSSQGTNLVEGQTALAGHMAPFLIPLWQVHAALIRGANVRQILREQNYDEFDNPKQLAMLSIEEPETNITNLSGAFIESAYAQALMPFERLLALPIEERPRNMDSSDWMNSFTNISMHPYLVDGTVTNEELLHIDDADARSKHLEDAKRINALRKSIPNTVGLDFQISLLRPDPSSSNESRNAFIHRLVEVTAHVDTPQLRSLGLAAHAFCIAPYDLSNPSVKLVSGTSVQQLHDGAFALVPMEYMDVERGNVYDDLLHYVMKQTMPPRHRTPDGQLYEQEEYKHNNAIQSVSKLMELHHAPAPSQIHSDDSPLVIHIYARSLWNCPSCLDHVCTSIKSLNRKCHVLHTPLEEFGKGAAHVSIRMY